jgi:hypothetical protein
LLSDLNFIEAWPDLFTEPFREGVVFPKHCTGSSAQCAISNNEFVPKMKNVPEREVGSVKKSPQRTAESNAAVGAAAFLPERHNLASLKEASLGCEGWQVRKDAATSGLMRSISC